MAPVIQTCASCPATREEPALKRKPLKGPWRCHRCYSKHYKQTLGRPGRQTPSGKCRPETIEKLAELVRSDSKAARLLVELAGPYAVTITYRQI